MLTTCGGRRRDRRGPMSAVVRSGEAAKDVREPSFPSKASEARPSSRAKRGDPGGVGLALSATPRRPTVEPFVLMVLALVVGLMQSLWYLWHTVYDRVETSAWTPTLLFAIAATLYQIPLLRFGSRRRERGFGQVSTECPMRSRAPRYLSPDPIRSRSQLAFTTRGMRRPFGSGSMATNERFSSGPTLACRGRCSV